MRRGQAIPRRRRSPRALRLRPGVPQRDERLRPGARQGAARPATATSTATATAGASCPTARRWCSSTRPSPTSASRQLVEQWKKNMTAIGVRIVFKIAQVAREPEGLARRQADDVGRRLERRRARRRGLPRAGRRRRTKGQANHARFDLPAFNALYDSSSALPDGPERQAVDDRGEEAAASPTCPTSSHVHRICDRHGAPVGRRLPPQRVHARLLAVRRHRHRAQRAQRERRRFGAADDARRCCAGARWRALPRSPARPRRAAAAAPKVLRYAFQVAETSFDPAQINDLYSRTSRRTSSRRCYTLRPPRAAGQDQAADRRRHAAGLGRLPHLDVSIKPGIYFADDPAFKGKQRELVGAGLRLRVQALRRPGEQERRSGRCIETEQLRRPGRAAPGGARRARSRSTTTARSRACARSTATRCSSRSTSRGRASSTACAGGDLFGAVAREVVEFYGDQHRGAPGRHRPVPARAVAAQLAHRARAQPRLPRDAATTPSRPPTTPRARRCVARFKGRRLPMVDRVEISIIEEEQPRWLAFLNGEADLSRDRAGTSSSTQAMPNGKVAPNLAKRGIARLPHRRRRRAADLFNMEDPVVGGYTPDEGRAAPRDRRSASTSSARSRLMRTAARRMPAQTPIAARTPAATTRRSRPRSATTTRRAPRRCSTCTATSTATATAGASGPTARRWCCEHGDASPTSATRQLDELWQQEHGRDRHARRVQGPRSGPRT